MARWKKEMDVYSERDMLSGAGDGALVYRARDREGDENFDRACTSDLREAERENSEMELQYHLSSSLRY